MNTFTGSPITAVFFDLDGTLVDTAPDIIAALNWVRDSLGLAPLEYPLVRNLISHGSDALVDIAFPGVAGLRRDALKTLFLNRYRTHICCSTRLFTGMAEVLEVLEDLAIPWGIVTNKPAWLTEPLLAELGLTERAAAVVSGDTLPQRKPDPAPLRYACNLARCHQHQSLYLGDAERDIQAGVAAGMTTLIARYGYIDAGQDPSQWGAHGDIEAPWALLRWLPTETG